MWRDCILNISTSTFFLLILSKAVLKTCLKIQFYLALEFDPVRQSGGGGGGGGLMAFL